MIYDKKDFINLGFNQEIKSFNFNVLDKEIDKKWILLIGHDSTLTGAPLCLYELALCLKDNGYVPVIATAREGKITKKYDENAIPYFIINDIYNNDFTDRILHLFSLVFVNTIIGSPLIRRFNGNGHDVIWWIHESEPLFDKEYVKYIPLTLCDNIHIYAVSKMARDALLKRRNTLKINILHFGIEDSYKDICADKKINTGFISYFNLGTITENKGQRILLEAISCLKCSTLSKSVFVFAGLVDNEELLKEILNYSKKYPNNVKYIGELNSSEVKRELKKSDCYICSSKAESLSRAVVEACSASKLIICSENAGIADTLVKEKAAFIYHNNESSELKEIIENITGNYDQYFSMRQNARKVYLKKFTIEHFNENVMKIVNKYSKDKNYQLKYMKPVCSSHTEKLSFDIYMDVSGASLPILRESINSIRRQFIDCWNIFFVNEKECNILCQLWLRKVIRDDKRINYFHSNINEPNNYIVRMKYHTILNENVLQEFKSAIENERFDFIYTDHLDVNKNKVYKPDYAFDTLRSGNYIGDFYCYKKTLLNKAKINDFNNVYENVLKITDVAAKVGHISEILYNQSSNEVADKKCFNDKETLESLIKEKNIKNEVEIVKHREQYFHVSYSIEGTPLVSIIICNKNNFLDLSRCIDSIIKKSTYKNYEIIIIDNGSTEEKTLLYYEKIKSKKIKIINFEIPFNFSKMNNKAVEFAKGEHLLFLNNDTEIISNKWIEEMLMYSQREDVGVVGAKLYFRNYKIQHAGVVIDSFGFAHHIFRNEDMDSQEKNNDLYRVRNCIAVTGACMMIKKSKYKEVGGFDEKLAVTYNDIDICLKLYDKKYINVWTPYAELFHHESKTRGYDSLDSRKNKRSNRELELIKERWGKIISKGDPYFNSNLKIEDK